jgi:hypothetical protein
MQLLFLLLSHTCRFQHIQNGNIPQFIGSDVIGQIFDSSQDTTSPCFLKLREGFQDVGI